MLELSKDDAQKELEAMVKDEKNSVMTEDEKKVQADKEKHAQEEKAKIEAKEAEDKVILDKKEEERTPEEDERVKTVLKEQDKAKADAEEKKRLDEESKLSADEKIQRIKDKTDKRIGEISAELKDMKDKSSKESEILRAERDNLRSENEKLRKEQPLDLKDQIMKQESDRIAKYISEDADKDRFERREMSKEDLDDWYLEDAVEATEWIQKRILRRDRAKGLDYKRIVADEIANKQKESADRVYIRHPELNLKARADKLKSEGKTGQEIKDIFKEDAKLKLFFEVTRSNPEYVALEDGPEKAAIEFERRLNSGTPNNSESDKKIDELTAKVEELSAALDAKGNTDEGVNSTVRVNRGIEEKLTAHEQILTETMQDQGASQDRIDSAVKKFRANRGA